MHRIILDTDIGTNPDDAIALTFIVNSPEIKLEGITTVYGDVKLRTKIAKNILDLAGRKDIKVYSGVEEPLLKKRKIYWAGIEGKHLNLNNDHEEEELHAVNFMIETIMKNPGEITLVTIGPLTNIATALIIEPRITSKIKEVILMGGSFRLADNALKLSPYEHNINCDPEAADIVFSSGLKITMVGLDITRKIRINKKVKDELVLSKNALSQALGRMIGTHMDYLKRDYSYLSDPIAIAVLLDRSIVQTEKMEVLIKYNDRDFSAVTIGTVNDNGNIEVCLDIDKRKFMNLINERVFSH